ncbi:50S ribosomal protein L18 [candidate division CPR3 bacterium 4484_211]|uniref:Large ribosomal subunit protein uL18 n=1 Tax=candidate division CPR3 bacterium 4484_211 TaxID=1968527 RepID=A0A1W9NZB2_UNCC3|nr:MAG: 50S ribosomal protein L18 [candidate division CPR3 bacterium 4484_211]
MKTKDRTKQRQKRQRRVRSKIQGTKERPRLSVFRSHKHIYAQLIDDESCVTLVSACDQQLREGKVKRTKTETAFLVGELLAGKASEAGIEKIVFDRGAYRFHGRIRALAEGARKGGLIF